jgi:hypothetical protein
MAAVVSTAGLINPSTHLVRLFNSITSESNYHPAREARVLCDIAFDWLSPCIRNEVETLNAAINDQSS